ncbi:MAG TPA: M20 family metallopeptidase [Nitrolancea sp.]
MNGDLLALLEASLERYLADLSLLAGIDSGSDDKAGVDAVVDWLEQRLSATGYQIERDQQTLRGDNLIARRYGSGRARILLLGHADTVYPSGTATKRPLTFDGDRILGPGTCDMKAGILSGIYALDALLQLGWEDFAEVSLLVVSDEETAPRTSVSLLEREGARHDAILTLEAARENGDIVSARKGVRWFTVEAFGRSAHAGVEPEKGRSATLALAHFIVEAQRLNGMKRGMTVNTGAVDGGGIPSVVVERARARFDLRAWTDAELDELEAAFRAIGGRSLVSDVTFRIELEPGSDCPAMPRTPGVVRLEQLATAIARELGFDLHAAATGGASDISYAGRSGTPGLDGLGPVGGLDHGPDEYILRSSIVPRQALLARLLQKMGAS